MPTLIIALDGRELQRLPLTRPRIALGRRPYNDIVMEHLAVSGEHAVLVLQPDGRVQVHDLHSVSGTYVNGRAILSADVGPDDLIEIARYQLRVIDDEAPTFDRHDGRKPFRRGATGGATGPIDGPSMAPAPSHRSARACASRSADPQ